MEFMQLFQAFIGPILAAAGAYTAIRADLAAMKVQIATLEKAVERAHARIDQITHKQG
jgi:hypothetical protein